jgi:hypothetical protein
MNTEMVRLINGALLDVNKAYNRLDDTMQRDSERLDEAHKLLGQCILLLSQELEELENE